MLEYFPQRWFEDSDGDAILMTNLCRRVTIPKDFKDNAALYMRYTIKDGESARDIAEKIYDDAGLFWVIYLANDIHNIMDQWPQPSHKLKAHLLAELGWEGLDAIHHYVDANGNTTDLKAMKIKSGNINATDAEVISRYSLTAVTTEDYEIGLNEAKRSIKLIDPEHTSNFTAQIEELFNE
ncbi:baseplate wedge protein [Vibrio phage 1.244.A._10N.261.54.C3]|nr:baseplate wedge protein [Vibrio phage 1.244.A._10N.261.54.C3]AUR98712.1 baseplate wedge protein [Vibrio phage 1.255.O._10N.286.45.F1]